MHISSTIYWRKKRSVIRHIFGYSYDINNPIIHYNKEQAEKRDDDETITTVYWNVTVSLLESITPLTSKPGSMKSSGSRRKHPAASISAAVSLCKVVATPPTYLLIQQSPNDSWI
jgi:hypothetical protein